MRLLQVIDRMMRGGGAEKFVLDLSIALNNMPGIEVDVLSISTPANNDFVDILRKNGIRHFVLSDKLYTPKHICGIRKFIARGEYDAVHVHLFPALYYAGMAKALGGVDCKLCYTEHSTGNRRRNSSLFQSLDRFIYGKYDNIIAISHQVKKNLAEHLHHDNIKVISNGIDIKAISSFPITDLHKEFNIPKEGKVVTMISRITKGKDHPTLVRAVESLSDNYHLLIVGDGPLRKELEQQVSSSVASERIYFAGLRKDVYGILKASHIVVLSTDHEGFSIAMLEAMACKKPFVASAVPGIQDLVDGVAELFEYGNVRQLADIISRLGTSEENYTDVAERCYGFATKYDINKIARSYIEYYKN